MLFPLNATAGAIRKADGMQLALDFAGEEWRDKIVSEFRKWSAQQKRLGFHEVTIEAFRAQTLTQPRSPKAWGSVPGLLCKVGLIAPMAHSDGSPVMRNAAAPRTRAHPVRVWRLA